MSIKLKKVDKLPETKRKAAGSRYDDIIKQFLDDPEMKYAEVTNPDIKTGSLIASLKARISKKFKGKVTVRQIQNKVYLEKL